ncbi:MAG: zinc ribbon domain-containing protein [Oscillospiraceae bacterium]|nr:zinc ribbon domain-containing protein [Oscillospiraceae bacterium]
MKSLWRKISFIMAWFILVLGLVGAIVGAALSKNFVVFVQIFLPASFYFTIMMLYLEHTNNVEMRMDQTYRKENNLPQLSESAYTNLPISSSPTNPYQQPVQPQYQQPVQYQQPAPAPVQQPAPAPAPVQQPVAQSWTCPTCGTANNPNANFCKGCGSKKG